MAKKISAKQLREETEAANAIANENIRLLERELNKLSDIFDLRKKQATQEEIINQKRNKQANTDEIITKHLSKQDKISKYLLDKYKNQSNAQDKILSSSEKNLNVNKLLLSTVSALGKGIMNTATSMKTFLMNADSGIKTLNLEMGLSGERAAIMRDNLEDSAMFAARMGVDMAGLTQMASLYADETGRVRLHSEDNLKSMTLIAKGTSLGIAGAAQMAGQYEMMGFNATDTATEVSRIVDTTERMGVNTGKVLKAVNANFSKLQKYSFRNGVKSMADMAIYAAKMKIDMDSIFEPMEKGRRLDSVIEMSAQLQVLGGNFANLADPMSMLFESRNDPEAYMKRINEMTKGMVTLNKTADGFDFALASPMAKDMLSQAAKALGMTTEELTKQAFRMREIQQTRSQMNSKGFTKDEKDIIEGLAKFDKTTGRMFVEIGGQRKDISNLAKNDIRALEAQKSSLEARAEASQTFDDAMRNTIMELKSSLLPLLQGINSVLVWVREGVKSFTDMLGGTTKANKDILATVGKVGGILMLALPMMKMMKGMLPSIGGIMGSAGGGVGRSVGRSAGGALGKGAAAGARGGGMAALGKGAGVGVAAVGIGTGVMLAAKGISQLADSMTKLEGTQILGLAAIMTAMALSAYFLAPAITAIGAAGTAGSLGLLAIGAAAVGVGAAVYMATTGIGNMAEGLAMLENVDMINIGLGIAAIGAGALASTLGIVGMVGMTASVLAIASTADNMERVGNAFGNISAVMKGSSSDLAGVQDTINSIASTDVGSNSGIGQLVTMLQKPLKVEFADKEVALVANVDVNIGDSNFVTEMSKKIPARVVDLQTGQG